MSQESIFIPFFGLMVLTIVVWAYMYYLRLSFMVSAKVEPQALATNREVINVIPSHVNTPSENLMNLFELPVLFYAVCIFLYVTKQVDGVYLALAYSFLILRVIHSVIHCTYNKILPRFFSYLLSSLMLFLLVVRAFAGVLYA